MKNECNQALRCTFLTSKDQMCNWNYHYFEPNGQWWLSKFLFLLTFVWLSQDLNRRPQERLYYRATQPWRNVWAMVRTVRVCTFMLVQKYTYMLRGLARRHHDNRNTRFAHSALTLPADDLILSAGSVLMWTRLPNTFVMDQLNTRGHPTWWIVILFVDHFQSVIAGINVWLCPYFVNTPVE